jgi:putative transposase
MARPLRIAFPGAVYHVTSRGHGRAVIYSDEEDRAAFLNLLDEVCRRMRWVCDASCLMTNHSHLVLEALEPTLSRGMRQCNGVYTQQFNRPHGRVGHVFQGRYQAMLVDREPYLLQLVRDVVLNPVRAGLVTSPEHWRWRSYPATVGQAQTPDWLATEWVLRQCGTRPALAHQRLAQVVRDGQGQPSIWHARRNQMYLGDEQFVARMPSQIQDEKPRKNRVRSCIATLPKKGQQCVVRQIARAIVAMETMRMIKMLKSHNRV